MVASRNQPVALTTPDHVATSVAVQEQTPFSSPPPFGNELEEDTHIQLVVGGKHELQQTQNSPQDDGDWQIDK
ncbi:hypothetical protein E4U26_008315 [Claviceps purpurea]|nr:hypothetical protein E4U26_008315 [Claviceps purpurea]